MTEDFAEIAHSGGTVTFTISHDANGKVLYQISTSHSRPVAMAMFGVYALRQGIVVGTIDLGGIGTPWNPPPVSGCLPVFISSDSQGQFGHHCPQCRGYWRSGPFPRVCPYCSLHAEAIGFLSDAQQTYVRHYCGVLGTALSKGEAGDVVIDMDAVADAAGKDGEKPAFYVSERSQQHKFTCGACDEFNDILGRFGFCSLCGTRNDFVIFESETIPEIRGRLKGGAAPEVCLRDAVSAFDSLVAQYAKQLAALVPLTDRRRERLTARRFQDLADVHSVLSVWFDIDICKGMTDAERSSVALKFHRRHVYEHNGGEVDQKYLDSSGDTTVKLKQRIRESATDTHELLNRLLGIARKLHDGFHELLPPRPEPIKWFAEKKVRMAR